MSCNGGRPDDQEAVLGWRGHEGLGAHILLCAAGTFGKSVLHVYVLVVSGYGAYRMHRQLMRPNLAGRTLAGSWSALAGRAAPSW